MKTIPFQTLHPVLILVLVLSIAQPVYAHGEEPRLEISVEQLSPGGTIDLRGVDFEAEELVTLSLTGSSVEIALGEVSANIEGVFLYTVVLPTDLAEGTYTFRAITDDHEILSPAFTVFGPPIVEEMEAEGQRDEDGTLLAPMPTYSPVIVQSTDIPAEAAPTESDSSPLLIPLTAFALIGMIAVAGMWRLRKR
ncbi:MAG: hypothetical protein AB1649_08525 [Chloroflexota bacterium]